MTAALDASARALFRQALQLVRSYPIGAEEVTPMAGGCVMDLRPAPPASGEVTGLPDDIWSLSSRLRAGALTIAECAERSRARIDQFSGRYGAYEFVAETGNAVAALTSEASTGAWRGPLHGIPISVKDVLHVKGMPTGASSDAYPTRVARHEGTAVRRLREAGAILTGKVSTHEFALGVTTPQARNPWDERCIPGGSSGGSAISLVTGMADGSLGTDTRASIRVPAALSGVVGFKPSFGRVPADGIVWLSWSMDHIAPMARSVRDVALIMDVLTASPHTYCNCLPGSLAGKRLRYSPALLAGADAAVASTFEATLQAAETGGAVIEQISVPDGDDLALANAAGMVVSRCEAAGYHQEIGTDLARCTPETAGQLAEAAAVTATEYLRAQRLRTLLRERMVRALDGADALIMPTAKVLAPRVEDAGDYLLVLSENCIPWSFVDLPAISLPAGLCEGLPVGVQIVGPPGGDLITVALAHGLEALLPAMPVWLSADEAPAK